MEKTTFETIADKINLKSEKIINYNSSKQLYWINIIIGNIKSHITEIYHGVSKRDLPLILNE